MFGLYCSVFSELAREHEAWIVAGSILLPRVHSSPIILEREDDGADEEAKPSRLHDTPKLDVRLSATGLYNVSLSFAPDGSVCNVTHKCFLPSNGDIPIHRLWSSRTTVHPSRRR